MFSAMYYCIYSYSQKILKDQDPYQSSNESNCFLQIINILTVFGFVNYYLKLITDGNTTTIFFLILYFTVHRINRQSIMINREKIFHKWRSASIEKQKKLRFLFWLYILLTIVSVALVLQYFSLPQQPGIHPFFQCNPTHQ